MATMKSIDIALRYGEPMPAGVPLRYERDLLRERLDLLQSRIESVRKIVAQLDIDEPIAGLIDEGLSI